MIKIIMKHDIYNNIKTNCEKTLLDCQRDKYAIAILLKYCYEQK